MRKGQWTKKGTELNNDDVNFRFLSWPSHFTAGLLLSCAGIAEKGVKLVK